MKKMRKGIEKKIVEEERVYKNLGGEKKKK